MCGQERRPGDGPAVSGGGNHRDDLTITESLLSSFRDVCAAKSVGQVMAQRCREAGITEMILHEEEHDEKSQKVTFIYLFIKYI